MSGEDLDEVNDVLAALRRSLGTAGAADADQRVGSSFGDPHSGSPVEIPAEVPPAATFDPAALAIADRLLASFGVLPAPSPTAVDRMDRSAGSVIRVADRPVELLLDSVEIGRAPGGSGLTVSDRRVSRRHVSVVDDGHRLHAVDLGSSNGTSVIRGSDIVAVTQTPLVLKEGDRVVTVDGVELFVVVSIGRSA